MGLGADRIPFRPLIGKTVWGGSQHCLPSASTFKCCVFRPVSPAEPAERLPDRAMTESTAMHSLPGPRELMRRINDAPVDWSRVAASVRGPLLTVAAAVVLDVVRRQGVGLFSPFPDPHSHRRVFGVYRRVRFGTGQRRRDRARRAPLSSRSPGSRCVTSPEAAASLVAVAGSSLLAGLVVARLHERVRGAESVELNRADAAALDRRFAFLEQGSLILSSARGLRDRVPRSRAADGALRRRLVHHPSRDRRGERRDSSRAHTATRRGTWSSARSPSTASVRCRSRPARLRTAGGSGVRGPAA